MTTETEVFMVRLGVPSNGDTIHRSDCAYGSKPNALRWLWADRTGFENIDWDALRDGGVKPCQRCRPDLLAHGDAA